jgi:hypothetical protein
MSSSLSSRSSCSSVVSFGAGGNNTEKKKKPISRADEVLERIQKMRDASRLRPDVGEQLAANDAKDAKRIAEDAKRVAEDAKRVAEANVARRKAAWAKTSNENHERHQAWLARQQKVACGGGSISLGQLAPALLRIIID